MEIDFTLLRFNFPPPLLPLHLLLCVLVLLLSSCRHPDCFLSLPPDRHQQPSSPPLELMACHYHQPRRQPWGQHRHPTAIIIINNSQTAAEAVRSINLPRLLSCSSRSLSIQSLLSTSSVHSVMTIRFTGGSYFKLRMPLSGSPEGTDSVLRWRRMGAEKSGRKR